MEDDKEGKEADVTAEVGEIPKVMDSEVCSTI